MISVPYEVKKALRDGMLRKNYRMVVLNDDGTEDFTIDNDTLVSESVSIDERMCSGDTLKFGLCEGSSLEFQYFNHPNIYGRRIQVFVDVECRENPYETVGELNSNGAHYRYDVAEAGDYRIYINADQVSNVATSNSVSVSHNGPTTYYDMVVKPDGHGEVLLPGLTTIDMIYLWAKSGKYAESTVQIYRGIYYSIPMGFFEVKKCSRQASTGIMKVTAYNKLMSEYLDQKANLTLIDTFTTDGLVSMFDIRYFLLGDYKIIEDRTAIASWLNPSGLTPIGGTYAYFGSFTFNKLYGVKSPINAKEFGISSTSTSFELIANSDDVRYDLGVNCQIDARYGSLIALEQNVVNYLKELINSSDLSRTWDDVLDYICTHQGFQNIIGVYVLGNPGKLYSTVQWEYEETHNLNHTVSGKLTDILKMTTSAQSVQLRCPGSVSLLSGGAPDYPYILYGGKITPRNSEGTRNYYNYYVDSALTTTASEDMPFLTFSDGTKYEQKVENVGYSILAYQYNSVTPADLIQRKPSEMPDFTLRELQSAVFETECQFGQLSRTTDLFEGVELNNGGLYPAEDLYPANDLYPSGASLSASKAMYSQLWADEGNRRKWRYLIITYKGLDGEDNEADFTLQRTVNADGTDDYNMSDNWLFRNLVWTAEQVGDYADAMVTKMQNNEWFPFEMWCAGLPYLETGDQIEIPLNGEVYKSYILQRQLKGIQTLQDTYINGTLDIFN